MTYLKVTLKKGKPRRFEAEKSGDSVCPECGGPSLRMWNWDLILMRNSGDVWKLRSRGGNPERESWQQVESNVARFYDWKRAAADLEAAVPGILPQSVSDAAAKLDGRMPLKNPRYDGDRGWDYCTTDTYELRASRKWLAAVHRWAETGTLPPPGVAGVCALHSKLVRQSAAATPSAEVDQNGALIVRRGDELLAQFPAGAWQGFELKD